MLHACRRAGNSAHTQFDIPRGPLLKLFLVHIHSGHEILTQGYGSESIALLTNSKGRPFSSCTFTQFWTKLMGAVDTGSQAYFPPSAARTMYVEQITRYGAIVMICIEVFILDLFFLQLYGHSAGHMGWDRLCHGEHTKAVDGIL